MLCNLSTTFAAMFMSGALFDEVRSGVKAKVQSLVKNGGKSAGKEKGEVALGRGKCKAFEDLKGRGDNDRKGDGCSVSRSMNGGDKRTHGNGTNDQKRVRAHDTNCSNERRGHRSDESRLIVNVLIDKGVQGGNSSGAGGRGVGSDASMLNAVGQHGAKGVQGKAVISKQGNGIRRDDANGLNANGTRGGSKGVSGKGIQSGGANFGINANRSHERFAGKDVHQLGKGSEKEEDGKVEILLQDISALHSQGRGGGLWEATTMCFPTCVDLRGSSSKEGVIERAYLVGGREAEGGTGGMSGNGVVPPPAFHKPKVRLCPFLSYLLLLEVDGLVFQSPSVKCAGSSCTKHVHCAERATSAI